MNFFDRDQIGAFDENLKYFHAISFKHKYKQKAKNTQIIKH